MAPMKPSELLADLIAESVEDTTNAVGVLIQDIFPPDPARLLTALTDVRSRGKDLRIAYLLEGGIEAASEVGFDSAEITDEIEQAERWRNQRGLRALIVVIARGNEAKLSSLEDFAPITSRELKKVLVLRASDGEAGSNVVQSRWWEILGTDDSIGLASAIDYYLAIHTKQGHEFIEASTRELHHLALLPDPEFFNDPKENVVKRRLNRNRELIQQLQILNANDRKRITAVINEESDVVKKQQLQKAIAQLDRTRESSRDDERLTFQTAERLVTARWKNPADPVRRKTNVSYRRIAAAAIIRSDPC